MLTDSKAYNGFAVPDIDEAKEFYGETLGLNTKVLDDENGLLQVDTAGGQTLVYLKPDFVPATYTILNFPVEDVEKTVDGLVERGVDFEKYDGFDQDERGIDSSGPGGGIAWFKDPAGNILSVHGNEG